MAAKSRVFWGYTAVGFIAMAGGIVMFAVTVPNWSANPNDAPKEMTLLFTQVYSQQANLHSGGLPFSPGLAQLGVEEATCKRFQCTYQITEGGKDYEMRMSQEGRTWRISAQKMIPVEVKD